MGLGCLKKLKGLPDNIILMFKDSEYTGIMPVRTEVHILEYGEEYGDLKSIKGFVTIEDIGMSLSSDSFVAFKVE